MERGEIMNITAEIITWSIVLGIVIFLLGTQVGRIFGQREMNKVIIMHKLVSNIWKGITVDTLKRYEMLLREYIKLAKGTKG